MDPKVIIIIAVILVLVIIGYIIYISKRNQEIDETILENKQCKAIKVKNKGYDYVLVKDNLEIYVKVAYIPKHSQVCINSKETWRLNWNTFKTEIGSSYSNNRYMDELVNFLRNDIVLKDQNKKVLKYIVLYKTCEGIVRYLNESELDVVTIKTSPYGYKIGKFDSFNKDLEYILKESEMGFSHKY